MNDDSSSDDLLFAEIQDAIKDRPSQSPQTDGADPTALRIENYQIIREIHRGGQGIVYEAMQHHPHRRVAVKVLLHGAFSSQRQQYRFEREVELIAALNHPFIVTVYDSGFVNGQPYYAMEYIEGVALNRHEFVLRPVDPSAQKRMEHIARSLRLLESICRAVTCFQQHGLIHRDLKPDNILVSTDGIPHVVDFGLARREENREDDDSRLQTRTGEFLGTLAYAAPEQLSGGSIPIDARCDVYALGVILFEILTGELPHKTDGSIAIVVNRICEEDPLPPSTFNSAVDRDVDTIVLKCLSHDADRRYQSAEQLGSDIHRYLAGEPIEARRDSRLYVIQKVVRKHWPAFLGVAAFVVLLVASSVVSLNLWQRAETRLDRAETAELAAIAAKNEETIQRKESDFRGYVASLSAATGAIRDFHLHDAYDHLHSVKKELCDFEWEYALSRTDASIATWKFSEGMQVVISSHDNKSIAVAGLSGRIRLVDMQSGEELFARNDCGPITALAFHPDGKLLVVGFQDGRIRELNLKTNDWERDLRPLSSMINDLAITSDASRLIACGVSYPAPGSVFCIRDYATDTDIVSDEVYVYAVDLSPDGARLATGGDHLTIRETSTGKVLKSISFPSHWCQNVKFSADGSRVIASEPEQTLGIRDSETLTKQLRISCPSARPIGLAIHPSDDTIAVGFTDGTVRVWNFATGESVNLLWGHLGWVHGVLYSDNGDRILSLDNRGDVKQWNPAVDVGDFQTRAHSSAAFDLCYDSRGESLYTCSFSARIKAWDVNTGQHSTTLNGHSLAVHGIDLSPDNRLLVSASADKTLRLWNLESGRSRRLKGHTDEVHCVDFSPDGNSVASGSLDRTIRVWDVDTRKQTAVLESGERHSIRWIRYLPDGRRLVTVREKVVEIWNIDNSSVIRSWSIPRNTFYGAAAFHPDGRHVATGGDSGVIRVWDLESGKQVSEFKWHDMALTALTFNPSGTRLVSASMDGAVKIWHVERQVEMMSLPSKRQIITSLAFSPDGKRLAATQFDGTMVWWEAIPPTERLGPRF